MNLENALLRGLRSAQPLATLVAEGSLYYVTDESITEQSRGGAWVTYSGSGGGSAIDQLTGDVTAGPGSGSQASTIPNNTVTYAKMQDVSAADKLLGRGAGSGSGDPQEITLGTNLTMSGATLNAAGGGGGGGLVFLARLTGAASASLDFTSLITTDYDDYFFLFNKLKPSVDATLLMRYSSDNGSSWISSSDYQYIVRYMNLAGAGSTSNNLSDTSIFIVGTNIFATSSGAWGNVRLYDPLAALSTYAESNAISKNNDGGAHTYYMNGFSVHTPPTIIDAVQFYFSSGNIVSGNIDMYGYAKA